MVQTSEARRARAIRPPVRHRNGGAPGREIVARRLESPFHFVRAFLRRPLTVGSFWPSSRVLSRAVVEACEFEPDSEVVELGPGTGAFTGLLLDRLGQDGRLIAVEINPRNAGVLRQRFPQCEVIEDSAAHLPRHLSRRRADCIVSGLAWGNMLPRTQNEILRAILKSLKPGGQFVGFAYVHAAWFPTTQRFRTRLRRHFERVETTPIVWRNLPPALVFRCWR